MASAPAENTPQLSHVHVFWKKNIFPLDVVRFLGGTEEGQPGGPRGAGARVSCTLAVFYNQRERDRGREKATGVLLLLLCFFMYTEYTTQGSRFRFT